MSKGDKTMKSKIVKALLIVAVVAGLIAYRQNVNAKNERAAAELKQASQQLSMRIAYSEAYDNCWKTKSNGLCYRVLQERCTRCCHASELIDFFLLFRLAGEFLAISGRNITFVIHPAMHWSCNRCWLCQDQVQTRECQSISIRIFEDLSARKDRARNVCGLLALRRRRRIP
jgi:hypothetical protein